MTDKLIDFREVIDCACPRIGGADCLAFRSQVDDTDGEECGCSCHQMHDDDLERYRIETEDCDDGY